MILLSIISIIIFIAIYYYLFLTNTETYSNNSEIYFMSKQELNNFLEQDKDKYVNNFSDIDLYARKVKTKKEYIDNILKTSCDLNDKEKIFLKKCCINANNYLLNCKLHDNYINYKELANIKWIICCTYKNQSFQYEEGLPHTRENVIFLSKSVLNYSEENLTNTLIHEKIHIYQRYNKDVFDKLIHSEGFKKIAYNNNKFIRSNPDTNNDIYIDNKTNNVMACLYRNNKPNGINDVIMKNFSLEHPYEKYAYEIANNYYTDIKYKNI